ncbi:MAG: endonuclease [Candidatus Magasanikbacteria bacterium]|nr:endonuclease [Candidatus Magasanikbacteria bacterium]
MNLVKLFNQLRKQYGSQSWWPVVGHNSLFEISIGAILTQNTTWTNVEKAIKCLLDADLMSPQAISTCASGKLQKCIRSSGYYKQKTKKLKIFSKWLIKKYKGNLRFFLKKSLTTAREELLSLWGIGPETADSILLYAGKKPIFVIDAYTKRLCKKYCVEFKTYNEYQQFFETNLRAGVLGWTKTKLYNEFHALIVRWGKGRGYN